MRASIMRSHVPVVPGGKMVPISTPVLAAWMATEASRSTKVATTIARKTTTPTCQKPSPIWLTTKSPMPMPTATPRASSKVRRRRRPPETPKEIMAAMGAKKGSGWLPIQFAIKSAKPAASPACRAKIMRSCTRLTPWAGGEVERARAALLTPGALERMNRRSRAARCCRVSGSLLVTSFIYVNLDAAGN